ncbi:MAG TPA: TrkA C-terminal domain-containing protein [Trebonia sp.]
MAAGRAAGLDRGAVYGRDGLPVLSADGHRVEGWVTGAGVLRALDRQITSSQADTIQAQAAADWEHGDAEAVTGHPTAPLPGYQVIEITVTGDSPAAGRKLGDVAWPPAGTPVAVQQGRRLRPPDRQLTLSAGDRVSLLIPAPQGSHPAHPDGSGCGPTASREASSGSDGT